MPKFMCIRRSEPGSKDSHEAPSPADMEEMYAAFNAWREKFSENIVDLGGKLGGGKVARMDEVTDGPFVEAKEVIGGFMVLAADDVDEAIEIARGCPGVFAPGASLEVREIRTP